MHLSVSKLDGLPSCVFVDGVCQRSSAERATEVMLAIAETADGIFRVGLCFLIVGLDIQESSCARRACFLPSADHLKPAGKPVTRHFARQLAGRAERSALRFALSFPRPDIVAQLLDFRAWFWRLVRLLLPECEARCYEQETGSVE